jgi:hypothetical protein
VRMGGEKTLIQYTAAAYSRDPIYLNP